jgi:hypothetical protein
MYNFGMSKNIQGRAIFCIWLSAILISPALRLYAETAVHDTATLEIAHDIWHDRYGDALGKIGTIIEREQANPLGYFLLGSVYETISEEYRNDSYNEEIMENLGRAITLAREKMKTDPENADWPFICGAAHGYRGLYRAFHGGWWGAFQDGLRCSSNLKRALDLDSACYDAYLGLGAYHYYKTVKSKIFLWLPFVADLREKGKNELQRCIKSGFLATYNARESLLRIYFEEGKYERLILLADSLETQTPDNPYCLLFYTRGLVELNRLDEALNKLRKLSLTWKHSPYYDPIGLLEAEYLMAEILYRDGGSEAARTILDKIISQSEAVDKNAYFEETLDNAKKLAKKIR